MPYFPLSWALSHLLQNFTPFSIFTLSWSPYSIYLAPCSWAHVLCLLSCYAGDSAHAPCWEQPLHLQMHLLYSHPLKVLPQQLSLLPPLLYWRFPLIIFLVHKHAVVSPIFKKKSSLDSIFPSHVTPSAFTQNYLEEHSVCNFSPFILSSIHLDEDFVFIYSTHTAPVMVANESHMLHPVDISHPLSSIWQWGSL